jgi:ABC-type branched-subunit amino acid transport system ATPase component
MLLNIENLTFGWLNKILFENININLKAGDIVVLMGENGCGKSTLLQIIAGMIPHFSRGHILKGDILIENQSIIRYPPKTFFPKIACIPDKNFDLFLLTENLDEEILLLQAALNLETDILQDRIMEFFHHFPELKKWRKLPYRQMKAYQKKLILLMIYFLQDATLFLLDEIFKSFPPADYFCVINFLKAIRQSDKTCLLVNHQKIDPFLTWELKNKQLLREK